MSNQEIGVIVRAQIRRLAPYLSDEQVESAYENTKWEDLDDGQIRGSVPIPPKAESVEIVISS